MVNQPRNPPTSGAGRPHLPVSHARIRALRAQAVANPWRGDAPLLDMTTIEYQNAWQSMITLPSAGRRQKGSDVEVALDRPGLPNHLRRGGSSGTIRRMKKATVAGLALILLTSACGGSESASDRPTLTPSSSGPTAPAISLRQSCPQIEAALPTGVVTPASEWQQFGLRLSEIADAGDLETKNALMGLQSAVDILASDPANGQPALDAEQSLLAALDNLAIRCKAVGSSALQ
jgi:hypothetical protein